MLKNMLRAVALKLPRAWHPRLKEAYNAVGLRLQGLLTWRAVHRAPRVVFVAPEVADVEIYEFLSPGPGEVLVDVAFNAVSVGTEVAQFLGLTPKSMPYWPGYSGAGIVTQVGRGVVNFSPGDRVAGQLKNGRNCVTKVDKLFHVPEGVPLEEASFIEIGIIVLQAIRKAAIMPGESALILGQGVIGHLATRLARLAGAAPVIASATSNMREAVVLSEGGADRFVLVADLGEDLANLVIEASGAHGAFSVALDAARPGGRVVVLGSARGQERGICVHRQIQRKGLRVVGAHITDIPERDSSFGRWTYQQEGRLFVDLLKSGLMSLEPIVTHRLDTERVDLLYEQLSRRTLRPAPVGVVLDWNSLTPQNSTTTGIKC